MFAAAQQSVTRRVIDERDTGPVIAESFVIDKVWAGHPVGFCLYSHGERQYIAYYNANRNMVVGQRNLSESKFSLHIMPPTSRETHGGTSTVLNWDSHNSVTLAIDRDGCIHLAGNMHVHPLTYFRSTKPHDISTLEQVMSMIGTEEKRCTYPHFMLTREGELIFHYRDGGSGQGNEIYNIYSTETRKWTRLLDTPLTDGQGEMNAYQTQPNLLADNWYHVYWVWRDTPDCETNHDLSYMKSPDLKRWYNAFGEQITMPATLQNRSLIVDPIPPGGGIINLAARLCLDENLKPLFVYHKYDEKGNLQFYVARTQNKKWIYKKITEWDYRWEFKGRGSINNEVSIRNFTRRADGYFEVGYWHIKYGEGTLLLDRDFNNVGEVLKPAPLSSQVKLEGTFPGLGIRTAGDLGTGSRDGFRYMLKWETLPANRDRARPEPWPEPANLYLYKADPSAEKEGNQLKEGKATLENTKIDGYRGIWFELGQKYEFGDKYSGALGTYTSMHIPLAVYSEKASKTFFVYGGTTQENNRYLLCMIGEYDHASGKVSRPTVVCDKLGVDDPHDNPVVLIDDQDYIWVFVSGRGARRPGFKYKSRLPLNIDAFDKITEEEMTYPQPWKTGEGFFHFFTKYTGVRQLYFETSRDGVNWTDARLLAAMPEKEGEQSGHYQISSIYGNRKLGTFFNRHPNGNVDKRTDLYYVETTDFGKTWTTAGGIPVEIPMVTPDVPARVINYQAQGKNVYIRDMVFDEKGNPVCLYIRSNGHEPGPGSGPYEWCITRWTGKKWLTHLVTTSDHNYDMGSLFLRGKIWNLVAPTETGPQQWGVGGEIVLWKSANRGKTWKKTRNITENSQYNHSYVRRPVNYQSPFCFFWADGHPHQFTPSHLWFGDLDGRVWKLPYRMKEEYEVPELVKYP